MALTRIAKIKVACDRTGLIYRATCPQTGEVFESSDCAAILRQVARSLSYETLVSWSIETVRYIDLGGAAAVDAGVNAVREMIATADVSIASDR